MLKNFFVIVILLSFCCFLYGIWNIFIEVEDNSCRMTYMFAQPQFLRVNVKGNGQYPQYGLYYYYEGRPLNDVDKLAFNGAPVIFVPGNGGSHKQARSLASVALRKSMENEQRLHFDYFTIDYNEELSGLYGGYLQKQKEFLKLCIESVLQLYKNANRSQRQVTIIGHSMGGKVAQAILADLKIANHINTMIFISSPLDNPVVMFDSEMSSFYKNTHKVLSSTRASFKPTNETNICSSLYHTLSVESMQREKDVSTMLNNILLISVGGGNRDLLVGAGYTASEFSDIHAMTSSIPKVWLSCDHLSSVWCLQFVLVVNRFLFSIVGKDNEGYVFYNEDKTIRLQSAYNFFVKPRSRPRALDSDLMRKYENENVWHEVSKRVFKREFKHGLRQTYFQLIQLSKYERYKKLYVETINLEDNDWIYGCTAKISSAGKHVCEKGTSLAHYIQSIPAKGHIRYVAVLDLYNIRKTYVNWSHVVLRLPATNTPFYFSVDIHNPEERSFHIKAPRWFSLRKKYVFNETTQGTSYYKIYIQDLNDPVQALKMSIEPVSCTGSSYQITMKLCVPWAPGFNTYNVITETSSNGVYVNVPILSPSGYNTSKNPIVMELYFDSSCRYAVSYQFSLADTMSRIVQQFYQWLPSHITAVLLIVLRNQMSNFYSKKRCKCERPYSGFFQYKSLYIVAASRIFKKILSQNQLLPAVGIESSNFYLSVVVHGTAMVICTVASFGVWAVLAVQGNCIAKLAERFTSISIPHASVLMSLLAWLPISFGVLAVSLAVSLCGGMALLLACAFYIILMSDTYKDYIKDMLWEKVKSLFCKQSSEASSETAIANNSHDSVAEEEKQSQGTAQNLQTTTTTTTKQEDNEQTETHVEGMQNFSFHTALFMLLFVFASLNFGVILAWLKSYGAAFKLPDPSLIPSIIVLASLSMLWQLKAPKKFLFYSLCYKIVSSILYACASFCVLYCQEEVYRLNFVIAFVFGLLLTQEILCSIWRCCTGSN